MPLYIAKLLKVNYYREIAKDKLWQLCSSFYAESYTPNPSPTPPLHNSAGVDPVSGKLGYKPMNNKKIIDILRALITCTQVAIMDKPTMEKIESFLGGNPEKRRIAFRMVNQHVVVLIDMKNWVGQHVIYLPDGNGARRCTYVDARTCLISTYT